MAEATADTRPAQALTAESLLAEGETMKVVPADMISRLPAYAGEVLSLNERLSRYVQFVASLEQQNQELSAEMERQKADVQRAREQQKGLRALELKNAELTAENEELSSQVKKLMNSKVAFDIAAEQIEELNIIIAQSGLSPPPHLLPVVPEGYLDKYNNFVPPTGHFTDDGKWIPGPGHFNEDGHWVAGPGYYDSSGTWVADTSGVRGHYDNQGLWHPKLGGTKGFYDRKGVWKSMEGYFDKSGTWLPGPVTYDQDGSLIVDKKKYAQALHSGSYDSDGNWVSKSGKGYGGIVAGGGGGAAGMIGADAANGSMDSALLEQQARLEKEFLESLTEHSARVRSSMQTEMTMESQAKYDAQQRAKALSEAMDKLRKRNRELEDQVKELEDKDLDRLQELEDISGARQRELDILQRQRAQAMQDAAEARAAKDQLERAIKQYEKLLDTLGVEGLNDAAGSAGFSALGGVSAAPPAALAGNGIGHTGSVTSYQGQGAGAYKPDDKNWLEGVAGNVAKFFGAKPDQNDGNGMAGVGPGGGVLVTTSAGMGSDPNETASTQMLGEDAIRVLPALPQNLNEMEQFMLLTDEGPVTIRARASGSVAYLKRMVSIQLFLSPRLTLILTTSKGGESLRDDVIIQPYAEGRISSPDERLLLTAAPRPLSDFAPGAPGLPPLQQLRIRTMVRGTPQALTVVLKPVKPSTTAEQIIALLIKEPALQAILGPDANALNLYFSPVFVTPDVLLSRKQKHLIAPSATLGSLQVVDDDIFYLSYAS